MSAVPPLGFDVCRAKPGERKGECGLVAMPIGAEAATGWLLSRGALLVIGSHRIAARGVKSVADLAHLACDAGEATELGILTVGQSAKQANLSADIAAATALLRAARAAAPARGSPPLPAITNKARPRNPPSASAFVGPAADKQHRLAATQALVVTSRAWRPFAT